MSMPLTPIQRSPMYSIYSPKSVPKNQQLKKLSQSRATGITTRNNSKTQLKSYARYAEKGNQFLAEAQTPQMNELQTGKQNLKAAAKLKRQSLQQNLKRTPKIVTPNNEKSKFSEHKQSEVKNIQAEPELQIETQRMTLTPKLSPLHREPLKLREPQEQMRDQVRHVVVRINNPQGLAFHSEYFDDKNTSETFQNFKPVSPTGFKTQRKMTRAPDIWAHSEQSQIFEDPFDNTRVKSFAEGVLGTCTKHRRKISQQSNNESKTQRTINNFSQSPPKIDSNNIAYQTQGFLTSKRISAPMHRTFNTKVAVTPTSNPEITQTFTPFINTRALEPKPNDGIRGKACKSCRHTNVSPRSIIKGTIFQKNEKVPEPSLANFLRRQEDNNTFIVQSYKKQKKIVESQSSNSDFDNIKSIDSNANCSREIQANRKLEQHLKIVSDKNQHQKLSLLVNRILTDKIEQVHSARQVDKDYSARQFTNAFIPTGIMKPKRQTYTEFTGKEFHIKGTNIQMVQPSQDQKDPLLNSESFLEFQRGNLNISFASAIRDLEQVMNSEGDLLDSIRNFANLDPQECSQRQLMDEANTIIKKAKIDRKQARNRARHGLSIRSAKGKRKQLKDVVSPAPLPQWQIRETNNSNCWQPAIAQQKRSLAYMNQNHLQHQLSATSTAGFNHISGELSPLVGPINKDLMDVTKKKSACKNRSKEQEKLRSKKRLQSSKLRRSAINLSLNVSKEKF